MSQFQSGALLDTRTDKQKEKDVTFKEVVAAANPVNWVEKTTWRKFPIYNQDGSGSCVAQTQAKEMGIMRFLKDGEYVHFSATDIYQTRTNKPNPGMSSYDVRQKAKDGVTLEVLVPSQNMTDATMDSQSIEVYKRQVGNIFSVQGGVDVPTKDIDTIASIIQTTNKGVMVWFYFKIDEWTATPEIKYLNLSLETAERHSVTAVDFGLVNGKKCLIIEDSWGSSFGMAGQRIITEDFFKERNFFAGYLMNFKFDGTVPLKPHYTFTKKLTFGMTDPDVKALQDILRYERLFPLNVPSTGYFGSITADAVLSFQLKYNVAPPSDLDEGHTVGNRTIAKLNELYA